jgi:hypothetical protein
VDVEDVPDVPAPEPSVLIVSTVFTRTITSFDLDRVLRDLRHRFPALKHMFIVQSWHDNAMETADPKHTSPNVYERLIDGLNLQSLTLTFFQTLSQTPPLGIVRTEFVRPGGFFLVLLGFDPIQCVRYNEPPCGQKDLRLYGS